MKYRYTEVDGQHGVAFDGTVLTPGRVLVLDGLEPDEEVFALRAHDPLALPVLNLYRALAEGSLSVSRAEDLERLIERIVAWQQGNRPLVRMPD